jgi:hypothetical protein
MKYRFLLIAALAITVPGFAQQVRSDSVRVILPRVHDIGIGFSSTSSFSLRYQAWTDALLYRITLISLGGTSSNSTTDNTVTNTVKVSTNAVAPSATSVNTPVNLSGGLNLSFAKIKPINDRLGFMFGTVIGVNISYVKTVTDYVYLTPFVYTPQPTPYTLDAISQSYQPFIGIVIGVRYKISQAFFLYAEISPNINYTYAKATNENSPAGPYTPNNYVKITNTYGLSGLSNSGALITIMYRILK